MLNLRSDSAKVKVRVKGLVKVAVLVGLQRGQKSERSLSTLPAQRGKRSSSQDYRTEQPSPKHSLPSSLPSLYRDPYRDLWACIGLIHYLGPGVFPGRHDPTRKILL